MWLISEASWKPRVKRVGSAAIELKRGQLAHSIRFIAEAWGWPKSNVARFLGSLKIETMIDTKTVHAVSVVTICKYDDYQRVSLPDRDSFGTATGTVVGQSWDKQEDIKNIETTTSLRSVVARDSPKRERVKPRTALPDRWLPDERDIEHAAHAGFAHEKIQRMASAFADHHCAKATLSADWNASWRTWCSNEIKFNGVRHGNSNQVMQFEAIKLPDPRRPATLPSLPAWIARLSAGARLEIQMMADGQNFENGEVLVLPPEMMPSPEQRREMVAHINSLRFYLRQTPAEGGDAETRVAIAVTRLRNVLGGTRNSELGEEGTAETFLVVLDDVPCWAVEAAAWKWLKHDCGTDQRGKPHDYRFAPDPGTLRAIALRIAWEFECPNQRRSARSGRPPFRRLLEAACGRPCLAGTASARPSRPGTLDAARSLTFVEAVRLGSSNEKTNLLAQEAAE